MSEQRRSELIRQARGGLKTKYAAWPYDRDTLAAYIGCMFLDEELERCAKIVGEFEAEDETVRAEIALKKLARMETDTAIERAMRG